ncbi:MAG: insulinase family protein [Muribaculaceae bacterium]|nr:insulinase family protein [Muribaculaceae bacterium]
MSKLSKINQEHNIATLPNGLRIVFAPRQGLVSYIGIAVNAGSRDEEEPHEGLAHFVEHTIFKGTDKRRASQIFSCMERIGGELNAYTSKEETMVYTNAPAGYEERALELLSDLVANSRFPSPEIDREREVITEEIYSYLDSPSERIFDEYEELAYKGSGLAHNILGNPHSVQDISGPLCRSFIERFYRPKNMVIYCVSPLSEQTLIRKVEKHFGHMTAAPALHHRTPPPPLEAFDETRDHSTHQANTIMGTRTFGRQDPRRFALYLLNNYLGGPCMNSKLNRELRERRGYVYTVECNVSLLSDSGIFSIFFGCDPSNVKKCRAIVAREIEALCDATMSPRSFEAIKRQYCGQLITSTDHIENRAMSLAKSLLYYDRILDITTTTDRIMALRPEEMRQVAEDIFAYGLSVLTLK